MDAFVQKLNAEQLEAVKHICTPLCILAGAGSGKTRVITHRICYLIEALKVNPATILGVTFTNKAAQEMKKRVNDLIPGAGAQVLLGTFHGIAARMLRNFGSSIGLPANFVIFDESDQTRLIKNIAQEEFLLSKEETDKALKKIGGWQNKHADLKMLRSSSDGETARIVAIYERYQEAMLAQHAVDFSSLLEKWRDLLLQPEALEQISQLAQHIVVDEYQDTNNIQAEIITLLGKKAQSLAVVGDDDQSIYGWRGAKANNLREFINTFPTCKLIKLEHNYRSTANILRVADRVIEKNRMRIGKKLMPVNESGDLILLKKCPSDRDEAYEIANFIKQQVRNNYSYENIAILMRTNSLSRSFEEVFQRQQMPYRLIGGVRFYDRKEIKDVLATLRSAINPNSDIDLYRAISAIPRGIGESSLRKARQAAYELKQPFSAIMSDEQILERYGVNKKARLSAVAFVKQLKKLGKLCVDEDKLSADLAVTEAVKISGIVEKLKNDDSEETLERLENLDQLLTAAKLFCEDAKNDGGDASVTKFLGDASLMSSTDLQADAEGGAISIMSLHAAKGLEFDIVCMVGMEEGCFPHPRALGYGANKEEIEEERRLAYVGITRAKKKLLMSYASLRMVNGNLQNRNPSRFLDDIPREIILDEKVRFNPLTPVSKLRPQNSLFGRRVRHKLYGDGVIVEQREGQGGTRLSVSFDSDACVRIIMSQYVQIL